MKRFTGVDPSPFEQVGPLSLQRYLKKLNELKTPDEVWEHFLEYCIGLDVLYVSFLFWSKTEDSDSELIMISNLPNEWKEWTKSKQGSEHLTFVRSFHLKYQTSLALGIEFNDGIREAGMLTAEHESITRKAAEYGWRSGISMPLRGSCEEEKGSMSFGTGLNKNQFELFIERNGWALSMAGSLTYLAYLRALKHQESRDIELTDRQIEFLRLSSIGLETKEIAYAWGTSEQAITKTRRTVMRKLSVNSKMAAVAKATKLNLIPEPSWKVGDPLRTIWERGFKTQPF